MRKALGASVGVGVLLIAVGLGALLLGHREAPPAVEPRSTPQAVAPVPSPPPPVPSLPPKEEEDTPPESATHIQGVVIGAMGPIPGARVTATYTVKGQTLSTLTCGNLSKSHEDARPFTQCAGDVAGAVLEHILAREGEAQGQAERESDEDGTFTLPHVSTDTVTLWVVGPHGAAMRPDVRRGTEGLQLQLAAGMYLEGQVVDEGGKPQVGARVTAMHLGTTRFFDTRTHEGGHYRLGPLPKAEYVLAYAMDGRMPTLRGQEQARQRPVVLLTPRRIQGRVSSGGAPVPNATVLLKHDTVQGKAGWEVVSPPQKQVTDAHGRFSFEELTPHRFELSVSHDGQHAIADVDLRSPRPAPEVDLKLGTALMLEGQVRNEEGSLLGLATASLRSHREETVKHLQHQDPHERYQLGPLKPGTYHLTVSAPGYRSIDYPARKLAPGQGPLDITLERSTDVLIEGTLVDEQDNPLPGIPLQVSSTRGTVTTDEGGWFSAAVPSAGRVVLTAGSDGRVVEGQMLSVQAPASQLRWILKQGARVRGKVLDEKGQPLYRHKLSVRAWREGNSRSASRSALTDSLGVFQLTGLGAGRYVIEAIHAAEGAERTASQAVVLHEGEQAKVELKLEAGPSLSGIVVDTGGRPLPGAEVCRRTPLQASPPWRRDAASTASPSCISSGPEGRFTWSHLPPGEVELSVNKTGFRRDPLRVQVGKLDVRLVLVPSGVARGRVLAPDGTPLARFQVLDEDVVSPQGTFILPREAVGQGDIRIAAPGMTTVTRRAVFRRETDVVDLGDIRMTPGHRMVGRVLDATTSEPISEAVVIPSREPIHEALDRQFYRPGATRTDSEGAFELVRVDETPLILHVEADGYLRQQRVLSPRMEEDLTVRLEKPSLVKVNVIDSEGQPGVADIFFDREGGDLDLTRDPVRMADKDSGVQVELEPGTYRVQAMGTGNTPDRFAPQRIQVPRGGSINLTLRALREGATLQLDVKNGVPRLTYLLPLGRPFSPSMLDEEFSLRGRALPADRRTSGTTQTFHPLPPGKLTLLIVEFDGRGYHVEELDIPARGTVKRTVTPVWRPHVLPH